MQDIGSEEFAANFEMAENGLQRGRDQDKLRFICLSLHAYADYQQFKEGTKVLEQYIAEHPNSPDDILGFQILVNRLDVAMMTKWSAWKSLLEDKKELMAEVESLQKKLEQDQVLIEELQIEDKKELMAEVDSLQEKLEQDQVLIKELQTQIEQLKNIENIIKSRETEQP
jgi:DNA repair exonuclease SbcCD ATPase subunit